MLVNIMNFLSTIIMFKFLILCYSILETNNSNKISPLNLNIEKNESKNRLVNPLLENSKNQKLKKITNFLANKNIEVYNNFIQIAPLIEELSTDTKTTKVTNFPTENGSLKFSKRLNKRKKLKDNRGKNLLSVNLIDEHTTEDSDKIIDEYIFLDDEQKKLEEGLELMERNSGKSETSTAIAPPFPFTAEPDLERSRVGIFQTEVDSKELFGIKLPYRKSYSEAAKDLYGDIRDGNVRNLLNTAQRGIETLKPI